MHPIERLRYVARAGWAGPSELAAEAAWALADLAEREPAALVPACRRLLDRQPGCGPLWWLCARVLSAPDPVTEAVVCAEELCDDPTASLLLEALPPGARAVRRGGIGEVAGADYVVVEAEALGATGMVADASCAGLIEAARAAQVPLWAEAGVGRLLPPRLWSAMCRRLGAEGPAAARPQHVRGHSRLFDHDLLEQVVGPYGARPLAEALAVRDCPEPPELLEH
ncbi:MAG TPA: hypothetical protein VMR97_01965 [Acidimicrobiales bacterium]|nr:hypothetical protein [Acidimicrobiales bacterium]